MSQYLRDETLKNLNLSETSLQELNTALLKFRDEENAGINNDNANPKFLLMTYTIRFDNKGFKLYEFDKAMEYFSSSKEVERFIFQLSSMEYSTFLKSRGKGIEIRFDAKLPNNCFMVVDDDNQGWSDCAFLTLKEIIQKYANKNHIVRNALVVSSIQILGVLAGVLVSLWIASKTSPKLNIPYPYGIAFIVSLIIFSNIWVYLYPYLLRIVNIYWPNLSFKEMKGFRKFVKNTVLVIFVTGCGAIIFGIANKLYGFITAFIK